jgi:hypothetical protein
MRKPAVFLSVSLIALACLRVATLRAEPGQAPKPEVVTSPNVKVLTGLYAQQFQEEMNFIVQALGVTCNTCHAPRGNFASDEKPLKLKARQMLEMTKAINAQFFPEHRPKEGESVLGRVTCFTCHKGETAPKSAVGF